MNINPSLRLFALSALLLTAINTQPSTARAQSTAISYQGRLNDGLVSAAGSYDFTFTLFDANSGGNSNAGPITVSAVNVSNGVFTTTVDFGNGTLSPFNTGQPLWLEIAVRTNGAANFFTLTPRQPLTPAPYAIYSANAGSASTLSVASNQTVNLTANGSTVLRIAPVFDPGSGSYTANSVGGYSGNVISNGYVGGFIGGGGNSLNPNRVGGDYASVLGGLGNTANGLYSTAMGYHSTASGNYSIAMGQSTATNNYSTAMGQSTARGPFSTATGESSANGFSSTAMGGSVANGDYSTAMGAGSVANGIYSTAMGQSFASGDYSTAMGQSLASGIYSTAMGGGVASGTSSTAIGFGSTASGTNSTAMGFHAQALHNGTFVWADSQNAVFASTANDQFLIRAQGGVSINTTNPLGNAFCVNGDARLDAQALAYNEGLALNFPTNMSGSGGYGGIHFHSTARNGAFDASSIKWGMFYNYTPSGGIAGGGLAIVQNNATTRLYFATNGSTTFYSNPGQTAGVTLAAGGGAWTTVSDRNAKENFQPVNTTEVLEKVAALPMTTWNYKSQDAGIHHLGPMAQDFSAAFSLGESATGITTVDEEGVALAAIQGLNQKLNERDEAINKQQQEIEEIKASEKASLSKLQTQLDQTVAEKETLLKRIAALEARDQAREDRLARLESSLEKVSVPGPYASRSH